MSAEIFRQTIEQPSDRVIVALDNMSWGQADEVMDEVGAHVGMAKANSIAQRKGWEHAIGTIASYGAYTMADTKFHDIPKTVGLQTEAVALCGASLITVHASGGLEMLSAAKEAVEKSKSQITKPFPDARLKRLGGVLGITVLTSIDSDDCFAIYGRRTETKVLQLADYSAEAGLDGIVCSGQELKMIRNDSALDNLLTVVPGITPEWAAKADDQKRIVTPGEAVRRGADYIVVGRAITKPPEGVSRAEAAQRIAQELKEAA